MDKIYLKIWQLAKPYLKKGKMKNFVIHTEGVIIAMKILLKKEFDDEEILMPAAILHDVGWSKVFIKLKKSEWDVMPKKKRIRALKLHIKYAPLIIRKILRKVGYPKNKIKKIIDVVLAHKYKNPGELNKRLLIDADILSDAFRKQFYSDVKEYATTPSKLYGFRKHNQFYTMTARIIFKKELAKRRKEFIR